MAIPRFTLYKHVKLDSGWRYCKAAWHINGKVKPKVVLVNGVEETHRGGSYYLNHNNTWIYDDYALRSLQVLSRLCHFGDFGDIDGDTDDHGMSNRA